jgi:hypothetical protein
LILAVIKIGSGPVEDGDILRFQEIADSSGVPYRDLEIEYAPLELLAIRLLAGGDASATGVRVAGLAFVCDMLTWRAIGRGWGEPAGTRYLFLGTPLLLFSYLRLDSLPVFLAVSALTLARSGRERPGGILLGAAILTKVWPAALAPAIAGRRRAVVAGLCVTALGFATWVGATGWGGPSQVATFRHATGWGVESTVGSVLWAAGGSTRFEAGAPRIGSITASARVALLVVLIAALAGIWIRWRGSGRDPAGVPSLAAVAALVAGSPLYSLQYAAWLVPWAAIDEGYGAKGFRTLAGVVTSLTGVLFITYAVAPEALSKVLLLVRNVATIGIPALWLSGVQRWGLARSAMD